MGKPCIICVAITGSVPKKKDNPNVPISIDEQIESTHESFEAGATILEENPIIGTGILLFDEHRISEHCDHCMICMDLEEDCRMARCPRGCAAIASGTPRPWTHAVGVGI